MQWLFCTGCGGIVKSHLHNCKPQKLTQGSDSWRAWRMGGVGSSDAPVVMNTSPWSTPFKLWQLKTGRVHPEKRTPAMQRGVALEPIAMERYQNMTGNVMVKTVATHKDYDFIRASLDGVNHRIGIAVEIKCPGKIDHAKALAGQIPRKYLFQLVQQLMVTDLEELHYFSFDGRDGVIVPFRRDKKLEKHLLSEDLKFWEHVINDTPPKGSVFKVRRG